MVGRFGVAVRREGVRVGGEVSNNKHFDIYTYIYDPSLSVRKFWLVGTCVRIPSRVKLLWVDGVDGGWRDG